VSDMEKAIKLAATAAGAALSYYGFRRGGIAGKILGAMGAGITTSTLTAAAKARLQDIPPRYVRDSIEVEASPERAFELWSRFEEFPKFMRGILEVAKTGERTWHWVAETPMGRRIEWIAELVESHPGRLISWRSITEGVPNSGQVYFEPSLQGTLIMAVMCYGRAIGPLGEIAAKLTGFDPLSRLREDLNRFKMLIEEGETARSPGNMQLTEEIA